jgi:hypothetical protein
MAPIYAERPVDGAAQHVLDRSIAIALRVESQIGQLEIFIDRLYRKTSAPPDVGAPAKYRYVALVG